MDKENWVKAGGAEVRPHRSDPAQDENEAEQDASLRRDQILNQMIGERVHVARKHAGLSPGELGQGVGLSYSEVQRLEAGQDQIAASVLSVIAAVVDQPVPWFFGTICSTNPQSTLGSLEGCPKVLEQCGRVMGGSCEHSKALLRELLAQLAPSAASTSARLGHGPGSELHAVPPPSPGQGAVLLVDDDPDALTMVGKHLEKAGYRVLRAEDAHAALHVVGSVQPLAAIVTDYAMPGMNGAQLLVEVALLRPGLPALIITGYADSAGIEVLGAGVEVLRKPFMRAEFITKVHRLVAAGQRAYAPLETSMLDLLLSPGSCDQFTSDE